MFPYIGGKSHHVKWMNELFPESFDTFVDVFGGAGWVVLKSEKAAKCAKRVYNDFNPQLANLYFCMTNKTEELLQRMLETPKSNSELFKQFQKELFNEQNEIKKVPVLGNVEDALKYAYLQTQVFAGTALSHKNVHYFVDLKTNGKYPSKYDTLIKKLQNPKMLEKLHSIDEVRNKDCIDVIEEFDSPTTFFYVDPPYYKKEFYYSKDFPREKHKELAEKLNDIQGKFALSYYDFPDLREWYSEEKYNWHRKEVYRTASTRASSSTDFFEKSRGEEILIF